MVLLEVDCRSSGLGAQPTLFQAVLILVAAVVVAVGLFGAGVAINDVLDARRMRHSVRETSDSSRQDPTGAGGRRCGYRVDDHVVAAAVLGPWSVWLTLFAASLVLFYNAAARFVPAVGIVTLGIIHAVHMLIPYPEMPIVLPVWWSMSHAMMLAIGVHMLESKRPRLTRRAVLGIVVGWMFWSVMLLLLAMDRGIGVWPDSVPLHGLLHSAGAMIIFMVFARWKISTAAGLAAAPRNSSDTVRCGMPSTRHPGCWRAGAAMAGGMLRCPCGDGAGGDDRVEGTAGIVGTPGRKYR